MAIVECLSEGLQSKEIASAVGRSSATIENYIRIIYAKLDARSRAHVVARAFLMGLLDDRSGRLADATTQESRAWR